jgi:hypothetical protein
MTFPNYHQAAERLSSGGNVVYTKPAGNRIRVVTRS